MRTQGGDDDEALVHVDGVVRVAGEARVESDELAREEPLEIRVNGTSIAVVMRTPGLDLDLVRGFLVSEGMVQNNAQIRSVRHCDTVVDEASIDNVVLATVDADIDLERLRRNLYASSSCGVCGKATLEHACKVSAPVAASSVVQWSALTRAAAGLSSSQPVFTRTGGLHAAALCDAQGEVIVAAEDVGRHNAVDKAIGGLLRQDLLPGDVFLLVSGRVSFEVVQKAAFARIPLVAAVSAPTSLAVDLARRLHVGLVGFLRGGRGNVYAGVDRLALPPPKAS